MPDHIVFMPGGRKGFVEVKAPGEKPRPLQLARHGMLRKLGFKDYVLEDTLTEHIPDYYSTVQLNVTYDKNTDCPRFKKFLEESMG